MGFVQSGIHEVVSTIRPYHDRIEDYGGDVLMNGAAPYYERIVELIDEALFASESAMSQQRIQDFQVSSLADLIQVSLVSEADRYRELVKESLVTHELDGVIDVLARLSLPAKLRKKKKLIAMSREKWEGCDEDTLLNTLFDYSENVVHKLIPNIREYSEVAIRTANLTQLGKIETKPEHYFGTLMKEYMEKLEEKMIIPYPEDTEVLQS